MLIKLDDQVSPEPSNHIWTSGGFKIQVNNPSSFPASNNPLPTSSVYRTKIKQMSPLTPFLFLIALLPGLSTVWGFHFDRLPGIITAFRPQTLRWIRDDPDSATEIKFAFLNQGDFLAEFGTTTVPETQKEGQIPFTFTYLSIGTFRVEGVAGGVFFTAPPTAILATNPSTTAASDSSATSDTPSLTLSNPDPPQTSPTNSETSHPTSTPLPETASNGSKSRANLIGGAVGGSGALILLFIALFLLRRKSKELSLWQQLCKIFNTSLDHKKPQDSEQATFSHPPEPGVEPYLVRKSATSPILTGKGQSQRNQRTDTTVSDHHQASNSRNPPTASSWANSSRLAEPSFSEDGPSAYAAMQAQMRVMMQRLERIEAAELEAPPDYVSSYSSRR
ncbi:hypothetical protein PM082_014869 [Marasmius tenuissimus]|nr:hypothetical protein PM082_014869 [Marasmius tenuissimus]